MPNTLDADQNVALLGGNLGPAPDKEENVYTDVGIVEVYYVGLVYSAAKKVNLETFDIRLPEGGFGRFYLPASVVTSYRRGVAGSGKLKSEIRNKTRLKSGSIVNTAVNLFAIAKGVRGVNGIDGVAQGIAENQEKIQVLQSTAAGIIDKQKDLNTQAYATERAVERLQEQVIRQEHRLTRQEQKGSEHAQQLASVHRHVAVLRDALPAIEASILASLSERLQSMPHVIDNMISVATGSTHLLPEPPSSSSSITCYVCLDEIETHNTRNAGDNDGYYLCDNAQHALHEDCFAGIIAAAGTGTGDGYHVLCPEPRCGVCRGSRGIDVLNASLNAVHPPVVPAAPIYSPVVTVPSVMPASPIYSPSTSSTSSSTSIEELPADEELPAGDELPAGEEIEVPASELPAGDELQPALYSDPAVEGVASDPDDSDDSGEGVASDPRCQREEYERYTELKRQSNRDELYAKLIDDPQLQTHAAAYAQGYPRRSKRR